MAGNPPEGLGDDFFEQILAVQPQYTNSEAAAAAGYGGGEVGSMPMVLQLGSGGGGGGLRGMGLRMGMAPPLGLNLEQQHSFMRSERFREEIVDGNNNCNNNPNNGSSSAASGISVSLSLSLFLCMWVWELAWLGGICMPFLHFSTGLVLTSPSSSSSLFWLVVLIRTETKLARFWQRIGLPSISSSQKASIYFSSCSSVEERQKLDF